jgi:Flp pilus assembly protein TadG
MMLLKRKQFGKRPRRGREEGHSLLETAILTPLLLGIAFNAINIAYLWYMVLTLSAIPRHGVQYASQGGQALSTTSAPSTTEIKTLVYENLLNTIKATDANASVQVCAVSKGVDASTNKALCDTYGPSYSFPSPDADPEAPLFVLNRVDVTYTVTPLIPGTAFNVVLPANLTFHRQVSMRSLY